MPTKQKQLDCDFKCHKPKQSVYIQNFAKYKANNLSKYS